jgi:hypothetical protein
MAHPGRKVSIVVVVVMMVVPALVVDRPLLVAAAMAMYEDVVIIAVVVAVDMDVAAVPVEVTPIILCRRCGRDEDQGCGDQDWNAGSHGSFPHGLMPSERARRLEPDLKPPFILPDPIAPNRSIACNGAVRRSPPWQPS